MSARELILGRLRGAAPLEPPPLPDVAGWYAARRRQESPAERLGRLREALEAARAEVYDTTDSGWPDRLHSIAAAKKLRTLLIAPATEHGARLAACPCEDLRLVPYEAPIESWRAAMFTDIDGALTRAKSAIAETGSLVIWPDSREPRLMSLVPPVHLVLLDATSIHADLDAAMAAEHWNDGLPTNALLISGPSKTADIQQTLAYGAHGPRELIVLIVHAQASAP